jgi:hypothetical protein
MFGVSSNQAAGQQPVATASNVPNAVSRECKDRPFAAMAQGAKADLQTRGGCWLSARPPYPSLKDHFRSQLPETMHLGGSRGMPISTHESGPVKVRQAFVIHEGD